MLSRVEEPRAPDILGIREVAARLGVSVPTLRRWDRAGRLTPSRHPTTGARVYLRADVEAFAPEVRAVRAVSPGAEPQGASMLGRLAELRRVLAGLRGAGAVVTLLGPGGIGKTTLARSALEEVARSGAQATFVDLSNATAPRVVAELAAALDVDLSGSGDERASVELVGRRLARAGSVVLVLDNAEHLALEVASLVRDLRLRAPRAAFLVTSRKRLRVRAEQLVEVGPLPAREATAMLVRAAARSGMRIDARRHAGALAELATRLDGIPLALEIAGAKLATHPVEDVLAMLRVQLDLGRGASARSVTPARHATLRAAVSWSYELLGDRERELLERLSVFRGGFGARAVQAVLPGAAEEELLEALREASLVHAVAPRDAPRFDMYDAVRAFAAERLSARPRAEGDAATRHAAYFAELSGRVLEAPPTDVRVEAIAAERDNVLVALERSGGADVSRALLLAVAADHAGGVSMPIAAREELLGRALRAASRAPRASRASRAPLALVARALAARGRLRLERGDAAGGAADLERARTLAGGGASPLVEEYVAGLLAVGLLTGGSLAAVRRALARAEKALRGPSRPGRALTLAHVATVSHELGDLAAAERGYVRALAMAQAEGQGLLAARMRARLGRVYVDAGRLDDAADALSAALPALAGDRFEGWARGHVALLAWRRGCLDEAREGYSRAAELFSARGAASFEAVHRALHSAVLASLARGVDASAEIERVREEAARRRDHGLEAAIVLAEAHRALLDARRGERGGRATSIVAAVRAKTRRLAARDKDVRALAEQLDAASDPALPVKPGLVVAEDGAWMTPPDGARADLPPGSPLRGLLAALATSASATSSAGSSSPGPVSREALVAAAWPRERIVASAAARRLHAAVSELRALGLGARLVRTPDGYRLASSLPVRIERHG